MKGWADVASVKLLTRQEVLDYCDVIDALDEAAYDQQLAEEAKRKRDSGNR